jgi:serine/threonine protein kinase
VIKISDFGCCTSTEGVVRETFCGTRDYQSPEMLMNTEHGLATDVWSLGIIAYELLTGKAPLLNKSDPMRAKLMVSVFLNWCSYGVLMIFFRYLRILVRKLRAF